MKQRTETPDTESRWYVVYCKPLKERQAAVALEDRFGLSVYLPEVRRHFRGRMQPAPFFPRYVFVQANLGVVAVSSINAIPGVLRMVALDDMPLPVPTSTVEALRRRVDRLNAQGGLPRHDFQPGDTVRFKDGLLQGLEAVFMGPMKSSERVRVLIDFLGRCREAEVDVNTLEPPTIDVAPQRVRLTRGKGRKIKRRS